jgi:hypothetical protein
MSAETLDVQSMLAVKFEPKRKNRWIFMIEGIDAYILKTVGKPQMTQDAVEVHWMNVTRYLAGKTKFGTTQFTLHDPIAPSGAQQVMEWLRLHTETVSGRSGYADMYKRDCSLKCVDPIGTVVERWDGTGLLLTEVNFGELTYEDGTPTEISVTAQADNWVLQY